MKAFLYAHKRDRSYALPLKNPIDSLLEMSHNLPQEFDGMFFDFREFREKVVVVRTLIVLWGLYIGNIY